jgi:hypothetical protein
LVDFFGHDRVSQRAHVGVYNKMHSIASLNQRGHSRWALIVAGIVALLGSFVVTAPAQAGYYPCSYGCGYPAYRYYRPRCYSCGPHLIYERRYVERVYVERRYGYGGYHRPYGYYGGYGGYRRPYGYPYAGYRRPYGYYPSRPLGYPYGYGGVGRRWPVPYLGGYEGAAGYEEPPRPPAPVLGGTGFEGDPYGYEN